MPDQPPKLSDIAERLVGELRGFDSPRAPSRNLAGNPARPRPRETQALTGVLNYLLAKHQIGQESIVHTFRDHWAQIVGPANALYSHAANLENHRLIIIASHAVVRSELMLRREQILTRLQQFPGGTGIKALSIRAG